MRAAFPFSSLKKHPLALVPVVFGIACFWIFTNHSLYRKKALLVNDMAEYYLYLPAYFLHHDVALSYIYSPEGEGGFYWYKGGPNGSRVIKMTAGVACMQAPFFALGHATALLTGRKADGWSPVYQFWVGLGSVFYAALALWLLGRFLLPLFGVDAARFTQLALGFATNYLYYASYENCMSHVYTVCVLSGLLLTLSSLFSDRASPGKFAVAGALAGLLVWIRPVNLLLLPVAWAVVAYLCTPRPFAQVMRHKGAYLLLTGCALLVLVPQFLYWKTVTGQWYFYSYVDEKFFFTHPHMYKVLLGYRKGLLVYCPIFFLLVPGLWIFVRRFAASGVAWVLGLGVYVYVISCWWCWWYGGSFGMRALIDVYPLLALPLAGVYAAALRAAAYVKYALTAATAMACLFLWLNYFQYKNCIIHFDGMNRRAYWKVFLSRRIAPPGYVIEPDYEKAVKGIEIE